MINKLSGWDDTIVAPVTAPGVAAIAVIRLSGGKAFEIADALFPAKQISTQASHTLHVGMLADSGRQIDEVVISVFRNPKSFTGEDTVEISCHGSMYIQGEIITACVGHGARPARAGEFTQRAFLNGKMDLAQAEAVADIIASDTAASQQTALNNIRGGFSHELGHLREQLISFAALIELELDFSTEDVEFADRKKFYNLINSLYAAVSRLIDSFRLGNVIKNGVRVAIIGKPNAGKSTLLNALLNEDRAIVSEIAGTTRDTIEEMLNINGIIFRLIDTAGIRGHSTDSVENLGIARSFTNAEKADLILHVIDLKSRESDEEIKKWIAQKNKASINVFNKADLVEGPGTGILSEPGIRVAAKTGEGIDQLKEEMYRSVADSNIQTNTTVITNERHLDSLKQIAFSLSAIKKGLDENLPGDLLSPDIRTALYHLGDITGEVTNEDKLDFIFSKFCIGK